MLRRATALFLVLGLLGSVLPAVAKEEGKEPALPRWRSGEQTGVVKIDGKEEAFAALVPRGYSPKKEWPIVLLAHGNGGKAIDFLRLVKTMAGKHPPLLVSLERCDNNQDAVGYAPKYLEALRSQFAIDEENVYALGFSGGGFRLWDDVICKADVLSKFRAVAFVGSAKQSFDPPDKPEKAPTVFLIGDPKDPNFKDPGPAARKVLEEKGYEVIVKEHSSGHSVPKGEVEEVFEWIAKTIRESRRKKK